MKYMLLIMGNEAMMNSTVQVDDAGMNAEYAAYNDALTKAGAIRGGERLKPSTASTTVKVRDGKAVVLAGPYADTQEQLGGFYTIEAATLDEAIDWASKCPAAQYGAIEVRPIWPTGRE